MTKKSVMEKPISDWHVNGCDVQGHLTSWPSSETVLNVWTDEESEYFLQIFYNIVKYNEIRKKKSHPARFTRIPVHWVTEIVDILLISFLFGESSSDQN